MASAAADGLFRPIYEGSISAYDNVERRPYHRNCKCALHSRSRKNGSNNNNRGCKMCNNVSYPIRRAWSDGSLALMASASPHSSPSPSSPAASVSAGLRPQHDDDHGRC